MTSSSKPARRKAFFFVFPVFFFCLSMGSILSSEEPSLSSFDRNDVLRKLSRPDEQVRKQAVQRIENAGRAGYRFLKSIAKPSNTNLTLEATTADEVLEPDARVTLSVTLRNEGPAGTWIPYDNCRNRPESVSVSSPHSVSSLYDRQKLTITLPMPEDKVLGSYGCGAVDMRKDQCDRKTNNDRNGLWADMRNVLYLRPGDQVRWTMKNLRYDDYKDEFVKYAYRVIYNESGIQHRRKQKIHVPTTWSSRDGSANNGFSSFHLQFYRKREQASVPVYIRPRRQADRSDTHLSFAPGELFSGGDTVRIRGRLVMHSSTTDERFVWRFRTNRNQPFAYLITNREETEVIDAGSVSQTEEKVNESLALSSWDRETFRENESFREQFSPLPPNGSIERSLHFTASLPPGIYHLYLMYGKTDISYLLPGEEEWDDIDHDVASRTLPLETEIASSTTIPIFVRPSGRRRSKWLERYRGSSAEALWKQLKAKDDGNLDRCILAMINRGEEMTSFLRRKIGSLLRSRPELRRNLHRYVKALGNRSHRRREEAMKRLRALKNQHRFAVRYGLLRRLRATENPEVKNRLKNLLSDPIQESSDPSVREDLRVWLKVLPVLWTAKTPESRRLLKTLRTVFLGTKIADRINTVFTHHVRPPGEQRLADR